MLSFCDGFAPGHGVGPDGELTIGGVCASELARSYETPLLVIDMAVVDAAIDAFEIACAPHAVDLSYAAKAFISIGFAKHVAARGLGLDVCSLGELLTAERAGFPAGRITFHGAGKTGEELAAIAAGRVGRVVADGIEELHRLCELTGARGPINVLLRLNTGIEAHTHAFVRTGGDDTKFGLHERDQPEAAALLRNRPSLRFRGLHAHIGSQIYQPEAFVANARALVDAASRFARAGLTPEHLVIGGGFGVQTQPGADDELLDLGAAIGGALRGVAAHSGELGLTIPSIGIEPGRAIVAQAGTTLYRVLAVKRQSHRTFVVVDGGIAENPRPALYGAYHHVTAASARSAELHEMTICGRSCENDELGIARLPRDLRAGDLLASCTTGAYTYSMAGNYNRFARPAVAAVSSGTHRLLIRAETLDDVLCRDIAEDRSGLHPGVHAERS